MKLLNFAVIATVFTVSFVIPVPAEARNPWIKVAESSQGDSIFIKELTCSGLLCEYDYAERASVVKHQVNCKNWTMLPKGYEGSEFNFEWRTILPGSTIEAAAEYVCNRTKS